jgi:two-component sensor histidine kinase
LEQDDAGTVTLIVEDDGAGMSDQVPAKGGGLGSMIVRSMAETLHATVELDRSHKGTRTIVRLTS